MSQHARYRILMFAPNFYPAYGAECLVNSKLALAFINKGWDITVITHMNKKYNFFDESEKSIWNKLNNISTPIQSFESWNGKAILTKLNVFLKTKHITNGMLWVNECIKLSEKIIKKRCVNVLMSRAIPEYSHLPAMYLSQKYKIPWIANWNDPVPNSKFLPPRGLGSEAPLKFYTNRFLTKVFEKASWHTFPSKRLRNYFLGYVKGDFQHKSSIIPHIALDHFTEFKKKRTNSSFIMCHTGGLRFNERDPLYLLKPVHHLLKSKRISDNIQIIFIGNYHKEISEVAKHLGLEKNVISENWNSYEYCLSKLAISNISVIIEEDTIEGIYLPSKISDYVQIVNPILAIGPKEGTIKDYIDTYGGGIYAYCKSEDEVASAIEKLFKAWEANVLLEKFKPDNLHFCFSERKIISDYENLFQTLKTRRIFR